MRNEWKIPIVYIIVSIILLVVAGGYDVISGLAILISGPAGCLRLIWEVGREIFYQDDSSVWQFRIQELYITFFAILLWVIGLISLIFYKNIQPKYLRVILLSFLWLLSSFYNIFWFGVGSM
jgi:hypothetical protein